MTDQDGGEAVDCKTRALEMLQEHEGVRLRPYLCSSGKLTIGYGRNLDDAGISDDEAFYMLSNDVDECMKDLAEFTWWWELNPARQSVLIDMRYNLGATGFRKFQKMIAALDDADYCKAAEEILDSKAARTNEGLATRYRHLSGIMRRGF